MIQRSPSRRPKSSASSSSTIASRERTSPKTRFSTRDSTRFMRSPIWRAISRARAGRVEISSRNRSRGIFQTTDGARATAKLSRGWSPNPGSSPKTSPATTYPRVTSSPAGDSAQDPDPPLLEQVDGVGIRGRGEDRGSLRELVAGRPRPKQRPAVVPEVAQPPDRLEARHGPRIAGFDSRGPRGAHSSGARFWPSRRGPVVPSFLHAG